MATRTVVCPACDAPLAPGRFACSACGALVATVASASRSLFPAPAETTAASTDVAEARAAAAGEDDPSQLASDLVVSAGGTEASAADEPGPGNGASAWPGTVEAPSAVPGWSLGAAPATTDPSWPEHPAWPPTPAANGPMAAAPAPASLAEAAAPVASPAADVRNPAGAYLPPSAVLPPGEALPLPSAAAAVTAPAAAAAPAAGRTAAALADGVSSLSLPSDPTGSLIAIGAGIAALGFLVPWADVVLGSGSMGTYFATWGLAGPGHLVVFGLVVALLAIAAFNHRLPRALRPGLPAVGLGFLLVGLTWPYLFGPFGATTGVYIVAVGALIAIVAGIADVVRSRHAGAATSV